jgi:peptidyl-prolyl cis-trans isomerase D
LAKVNAVKQIGAKPLATVRGEIAKIISTQKREELLADLTADIESELDGGSTIADIAKAQGLKIDTTPKLFANGQDPQNPGYKPIAEMARILPAAFELESDGSGQLVEVVPGEKFAIVSVAEAEEAAPAPLKEIRDVVAKQWALAEGDKKAKAAADQVKKAMAGGKSLNEALSAIGVRLPAPETVSGTRGQLTTGQQIPPPLMMLFAMKKGTVKTINAGGDRGWFVVQLNEIIKGDASKQTEMLAARREEMEGLLAQEYIAQMINAAVKETGVKRNEELITRRRKELTNRGSSGQ